MLEKIYYVKHEITKYQYSETKSAANLFFRSTTTTKYYESIDRRFFEKKLKVGFLFHKSEELKMNVLLIFLYANSYLNL